MYSTSIYTHLNAYACKKYILYANYAYAHLIFSIHIQHIQLSIKIAVPESWLGNFLGWLGEFNVGLDLR